MLPPRLKKSRLALCPALDQAFWYCPGLVEEGDLTQDSELFIVVCFYLTKGGDCPKDICFLHGWKISPGLTVVSDLSPVLTAKGLREFDHLSTLGWSPSCFKADKLSSQFILKLIWFLVTLRPLFLPVATLLAFAGSVINVSSDCFVD